MSLLQWINKYIPYSAILPSRLISDERTQTISQWSKSERSRAWSQARYRWLCCAAQTRYIDCINWTKTTFQGGRVQQPFETDVPARMRVCRNRRLDRSPTIALSVQLWVGRKYLESRLYMDYIYPGCMWFEGQYEYVKITTPNEGDKILRHHWNKSREPTDDIANCSRDK